MPIRALAALATAMLLVAVTAGSASAGGVTVRDRAGDMWRMSFDGKTSKAPNVRSGDVRRAVFRHGKANVVIRMKYAQLRRVGQYAQYAVRIQNRKKNRYREVQVEAARGSWRGQTRVFDRRGNRVGCKARHRIDYRRNVVTITVPRSCVGRPKYVRVTAGSFWAQRSRQSFLFDNPHTARQSARTWTRWLRTG